MNRNFNEMEKALLKNEFKNQIADIGFEEGLVMLNEILQAAIILSDVLIEEKQREYEETEEGDGMDTP